MKKTLKKSISINEQTEGSHGEWFDVCVQKKIDRYNEMDM